jgi:hypothetical protein
LVRFERPFDTLGSGGGGGSTPIEILNSIRTLEPMIFDVDYVTGQSPPADTVVRTQAEYAALGFPLRFAQEVEEILPQNVDFSIIARVAAGEQYAKPDAAGSYSAFMFRNPLWTSNRSQKYNNGLDRPTPGIRFVGAITVLDAALAGVTSQVGDYTVFTRDAGTWAPDALRGKFVEIESGIGTGTKCLIRSNTDTVLTLAMRIVSVGACVVDTYESATTFVSSENGVDPTMYGFIGFGDGSNAQDPIEFENINFGKVSLPFSYSNLSGTAFSFKECTYRGNLIAAIDKSYHSYVLVRNSHVVLENGNWLIHNSLFDFYGVLFTGNSNNFMLRLREQSHGAMSYTFFEPSLGFTGSCLDFIGSNGIRFDAGCEIIGDTTCIGLQLDGAGETARLENNNYLSIFNCSVGLRISNGLLHLKSFGLSTGNNLGYSLDKGQMSCSDFARLGVVDPSQAIELGTGNIIPYSFVTVSGDEVVAATGESVLVR